MESTGIDASISVVLPVRNGSAFLREALESVLGQSFTRFEVLCIDDGSTDDTPAILAEVSERDSRIRVLRTEGNGLVSALNLALREARFPLVARMDADDVCEPTRFERQQAWMARHPNVGALGTAATLIDEKGGKLGAIEHPSDPSALSAALLEGNAMIHPTVLLRRSLVERVGGYRSIFFGAEDYDLWLRMADLGPVANLPERLLRYRVHGGQVSVVKVREQVFAAQAARFAALARRRDGEERAFSSLSEDSLVEAGVPRSRIRREILDQYIGQAYLMMKVGAPYEAERMLIDAKSLCEHIPRPDGRVFRVARLLWKLGRRSAGIGSARGAAWRLCFRYPTSAALGLSGAISSRFGAPSRSRVIWD